MSGTVRDWKRLLRAADPTVQVEVGNAGLTFTLPYRDLEASTKDRRVAFVVLVLDDQADLYPSSAEARRGLEAGRATFDVATSVDTAPRPRDGVDSDELAGWAPGELVETFGR